MSKLIDVTYTVEEKGEQTTRTLIHTDKKQAVSLVVVDMGEENEIQQAQSHGWGSVQTRMFAILQEIAMITDMEGVEKKDVIEVLQVTVAAIEDEMKIN